MVPLQESILFADPVPRAALPPMSVDRVKDQYQGTLESVRAAVEQLQVNSDEPQKMNVGTIAKRTVTTIAAALSTTLAHAEDVAHKSGEALEQAKETAVNEGWSTGDWIWGSCITVFAVLYSIFLIIAFFVGYNKDPRK